MAWEANVKTQDILNLEKGVGSNSGTVETVEHVS